MPVLPDKHGAPTGDAYKEYRSMLKLLDDQYATAPDVSKDDVYAELTRKEDKVLDTLKAMAQAQRRDHVHDALLYNRSVIDVVGAFTAAWTSILSELINEGMYRQPLAVLWDGDRKIYVGMMVVLVALLLFFIHNST